MRPTFFTVDVEHDCPPFRTSYRGIEEGLPKLLGILNQKKISATFFVTGDVARRYPGILRDMVAEGHEIGCHGDSHARFDHLNAADARNEIARATETLRYFYPVISFRAPNLQFPRPYLKFLAEYGYKIDSSGARHKRPWLKPTSESGLLRVPVSTTSLILRLSPFWRNCCLGRMKDPVVLFVHPWEFVDLQAEKLRFDCRWRTGDFSLKAISETLSYFQNKGGQFKPLSAILETA